MKVKNRATLSKNKALRTESNKRNFHKDSSIIIMAPEFKKGGGSKTYTSCKYRWQNRLEGRGN